MCNQRINILSFSNNQLFGEADTCTITRLIPTEGDKRAKSVVAFSFSPSQTAVNLDQRKNLRDFISMHIIFVQFLIERVSDLTIAYLFYIISTFTKDIRKQSPIT